MEMIRAQSPDEIDDARRLFREYEAFLDVDLCFQDFEAELASLPGKYGGPEGELLLAYEADHAVGCVALRRLEDGVCEMKRLFVRPAARGRGLGRQLAEEIVRAACELGYATMRLDTLERLEGAMHLYEGLGFRRIGAYYDNPLAEVAYFEADLYSSS
ncbi:MAG: putative acetyltransferase [Verrucomicrobiales bacterium]|jgi:putative acetyltransferase